MPVSDTLGYMLLIMITSMLVMEFIPKLPFKDSPKVIPGLENSGSLGQLFGWVR